MGGDAGVVVGQGAAIGGPGAGRPRRGIGRHLGVEDPEADVLHARRRAGEHRVHPVAVAGVEDAVHERRERRAVRRHVDPPAARRRAARVAARVGRVDRQL